MLLHGQGSRKLNHCVGGFSLVRGQTSAEYRKRESEIYDRIRKASDEFSRLSKGADTTEALRRLEAALAEFESFRYEL
ncbi:hypothetical protein SRRS_07750 [Sporomusa rhizae]|uniref:hypothetical protein n=1 Tax=Sporomusa rhizae TaxID=357999 RepID=UPI00352A2184